MERTGRRASCSSMRQQYLGDAGPSMLQFLQFKTFGMHRIPDGWVVVTAGNPPEYSNSVPGSTSSLGPPETGRHRASTSPPEEYAYEAKVHPAATTYLSIKNADFYLVQTVDGKRSSARGWEDLSDIIYLYERTVPSDRGPRQTVPEQPHCGRVRDLLRPPQQLQIRLPDDKIRRRHLRRDRRAGEMARFDERSRSACCSSTWATGSTSVRPRRPCGSSFRS